MADKVLTGFGWYEFDATIQTNISREYLDNEGAWDEWAAWRECVQNAMDEADWCAEHYGGDMADHCFCDIKAAQDRVRLSDRGRGVELEHIVLLGRSDKRGNAYRGEKGEGQLMAFLVFTKAGIEICMFSRDWMMEPRFDKYNGGSNDVLVLDVYRNTVPDNPKAPVGTHWLISGSSYVVGLAQNMSEYFPEFSRAGVRKREAEERESVRYWAKREKLAQQFEQRERTRKSTSSTKAIFKPHKDKPPRLYLRGIYVRDLTGEPKAMFSYNLYNVDINRDRDMVDQFGLLAEVGVALASDEVTPAMMKIFWKQARDRADFLEYRCEIEHLPTEKLREKWLRAFKAVYGRKVCIATHPNVTKDCLADGWEVVGMRSEYVQEFAISIGIPTDRQAAGFGDEDYTVVEPTKREHVILDLVEQVVDELGITWRDVNVVSKMLDQDATNGFYKDGEVFVLRKAFKRGGLEVLRIVLHELGHGETNCPDYDRSFTDWFLRQWISTFAVDDVGWFTRVVKLVKELEVV